MTAELWQRLKPLYNAALDLPEADRTAYVERTCGDDAELAAELRALLHAEENSTDEFASPLKQAVSSVLLSLERPLPLAPDTLLVGRFRIVRHLGSGGMGDVYEAVDEQLEGGRIALKTIRPAIATNPVTLARFKDEVRTARRVSGTNVCRIHELYLTGARDATVPAAFLTMELLEGVTLHDRIEQGGPLSLAQVRDITDQLCTALDCIHQAGVIHQDLKPRNVMLVQHNGNPRVVVTDFGLARAAVSLAPTSSSPAEPALIAGTPAYMAPEQFEGREVGPPADIYALGLILYEMATGVQPYAAHTPLAAAIRRSKPPTQASSLRRDMPPIWDDLIACCLRYDPADRYQSAEDVRHALRHPGKVVMRLGEDHRVAVPTPALLTFAAVLAVVLLGSAWFAFVRPRHRELAPDAAHWYAMGMTALREGSYLKATKLLAMVVQRDPTYALAHAALADAWTELDFTQNAQQEMLLASAPDEQRGLNEVERRYIDAVRTTLVRDYSSAAQDYEAILNKLPADSKAQGYVDLGRIYEKAGKVQQTLASYDKAARLNPDDPAPFLHLGILKNRLRDRQSAEQAFSHAESLYAAESNQEGLAEVAYQRGYADNEEDDSTGATEELSKSLLLAKQVPSVQLEVRSLSQLSSVAYNNSKDDDAIRYANQEVQLARAKGLEYWVTDGLMRQGNALLDKEDHPGAERALEDALQRAQASSHPRLEAFIDLSLASLRYRQKRWDDEIAFAKHALTYFQDYGFNGPADQTLILIARGERAKGNYDAALQAGRRLLANATSTHSAASGLLAEELVGGILLRLERYPEALDHYTRALELATGLKQNVAYHLVARAQVLTRLGRFGEAKADLAGIPADSAKRFDIGTGAAVVQAEMSLSEGEARGAIALVHEALKTYPKLDATNPPAYAALLRTLVLAEEDLDLRERAQQHAVQLEVASERGEVSQVAQAKLVNASFALRRRDLPLAKSYAADAARAFASSGMKESEALSLLTGALAAEAMGDAQSADALSKKSVDIYRQIAQSWGVPALQRYFSRPDRKEIMPALQRLRAANGGSNDELFR